MKFIEVTCLSGLKLSLNLDKISCISPYGQFKENTLITLSDIYYTRICDDGNNFYSYNEYKIKESYENIMNKLEGKNNEIQRNLNHVSK